MPEKGVAKGGCKRGLQKGFAANTDTPQGGCKQKRVHMPEKAVAKGGCKRGLQKGVAANIDTPKGGCKQKMNIARNVCD